MRMSDWSSDVCSSDLSLSKEGPQVEPKALARRAQQLAARQSRSRLQIFPRSSRIVDDVAIPVDDHMRWRRSDERRVGEEGVSTCRSRWEPYHSKKKR